METTQNIAQNAATILRGSVKDRYCGFIALMAICHAKKALLEINENEITASSLTKKLADAVLKKDGDENIYHFVKDVLESSEFLTDVENTVVKVCDALPNDADELADIILDIDLEEAFASQLMRGEGITPASVTALALKLLDIQDGERVADFGTGTGSFLVKAARQADCELVYGCEINTISAAIAEMRAKALGPKTEVKQESMFSTDKCFDKCFSNYPFGMKARGFKDDALHSLAEQGYDNLPRFNSGDWVFNLQLVAKLKEGGKAIGIMTRGSSFNGADEKIREYFISNGFIEAAVALPAGLFSPYTNIATTLLILSEGSETVRLVDASEICEKGRRETTLSNDNIARIADLLTHDEEGLSCSLAYKDFAQNGFILNPERYLTESISVKNGVSIDDLATHITRGSTCKKAELEEFNSKTPTKFRYLMLQDIEDGEIRENLPYLNEIPKNQQKYCAQDGDLVISKMGPNFKVAVAETPEGEAILATGNLYIIHVDKSKVDPRYLKLYLESDQGVAQLRRSCVGTTIPSVPMSAFKDILVPMVSAEEQQEIVENYEKLRQEILMHKIAIERARHKMASLLTKE